MEISLTKEEYLLLLEMLYLADWVLHAHQVGENQETRKYKELVEKFLSYAKDYGLEEYVIRDPHRQKHYYARKFEEERPMKNYLRRFEDEFFWEELEERLAWRDLVREYGEKAVKKLDFLTKMKKLDNLQEKYAEEFAQNGLEHLRVEKFSEARE